MSSQVEIKVGGTKLTLLGEGGAFCQQEATLFVADTHLGKDATFRRFGMPVPVGSCSGTLHTIGELLDRTNATRLVILGDMFHARSSLTRVTTQSVEQFFSSHDHIEMQLVRGNHDEHVGRFPSHWPIEIIDPGIRLGRIALAHEPSPLPEASDVLLCGHLHPAIRMGTLRDHVGKLPCFWLSGGCLVFPAIGQFTGTHVIRPKPGDAVWAIADKRIISLRPHA